MRFNVIYTKEVTMGHKYLIRTNEERMYPLQTIGYTDYYTNNIFSFIKLLIIKRRKILYATKWF